MKKLISLIIIAALSPFAIADEYVPGYVRRDGKIVEGYFRSSPNGNALDNYSTRGNFNPNTGRVSTRELEMPATSGNDLSPPALQVGPRGGQYYYNDSGKKVYVPKR